MTSRFDQLWTSLEDEDMRRAFILDVSTGLAFQIRLLREKSGWTREQLADRVGREPAVVSQWENPNYDRYTIEDIKSLAAAFDVGLIVRFAPFSEVINWNADLTLDRIAPPSYTEERDNRDECADSHC